MIVEPFHYWKSAFPTVFRLDHVTEMKDCLIYASLPKVSIDVEGVVYSLTQGGSCEKLREL